MSNLEAHKVITFLIKSVDRIPRPHTQNITCQSMSDCASDKITWRLFWQRTSRCVLND